MLLSEKLLQYIWRFRLFNIRSLETTNGEPLQILSPGVYNTDGGPDFLQARIKIGGTVLAGHIELHVRSSDWRRHHHQDDQHYRNVILHVVFEEDDSPAGSGSVNTIPVLELRERIAKIFLERYGQLMEQTGSIPCAGQLHRVNELLWESWKDRLLVERWEEKTNLYREWLLENHYNWEETFYQALGRNFGMPVNTGSFELLVRSLPLNLLARHRSHPLQTAALLFGQAGFLEGEFHEAYPLALQKEYRFLLKKYDLLPASDYGWQWLRMRPANFPSVKIAQFAALMSQAPRLFSKMLEAGNIHDVYDLLNVDIGEYWISHYRFDQVSVSRKKTLGLPGLQNLLINTISPMLFLYGKEKGMPLYIERAFYFLRHLAAEKNIITRKWKETGVANKTAWDSQALIHLKKHYCDTRRCLECAIGNRLLRPDTPDDPETEAAQRQSDEKLKNLK